MWPCSMSQSLRMRSVCQLRERSFFLATSLRSSITTGVVTMVNRSEVFDMRSLVYLQEGVLAENKDIVSSYIDDLV